MGAHNSRQVQLVLDSNNTAQNNKKKLSRRASTGALLTRQERLEYSRAASTAQAAKSQTATRAATGTLSSASSLGCLLSGESRSTTRIETPGDGLSQATSTSEVTHVASRTSSKDETHGNNKEPNAAPPAKTALTKRNSKSLSISRIAPTLKKLARRSSKTVGGSSGKPASNHEDATEYVSTEFLNLQRDETIVDGDVGDTSSTVEWNGTTLRKSWFNEEQSASEVNLTVASTGNGAASSRATSRADSVHDVQQRSASLSSRQCRRAGSVGSLLSTSQVPANNSASTDELISTASAAVSTLSLASNGATTSIRPRCSSQASNAFSTATNNSRRSSSSSLAAHSTFNPLFSYSRQQSSHSASGAQSAITPQSQVSASFNTRSSSRSHSRSSNRYSSPSCSPPLTRAPTKLELLLGFSRCAVARCPGIGARYEDVELWVRGTDRALIKSGWQEQPFLCTGNLVLVYGIFLVAMQTETVRTIADLRGVVLTCLYIAFTYGGHEISYPLKPFLYTNDRALFWDRCVRIALSSSSLMLQINRQEPLYHDLLISLHDELYTG